MTDFDPNATPFCDMIKFKGYASDANDMPEETFVYYTDAQRLERRACLAEEKLERYRRAVQILKLTFENQGLFDAAKATQEKIEEIESVGTYRSARF